MPIEDPHSSEATSGFVLFTCVAIVDFSACNLRYTALAPLFTI